MKLKGLFIFMLASIMCLSSCALGNSGTKVPFGIVSTSTAICEILDKLEIDDVVGVPTVSGNLPVRYDEVRKIGAPMNPDMEIVKSINPEIVLTPKTLQASLSVQYANVGLNSRFMNLSSVEGFYDEIVYLGEQYDRKAQADKLVLEYETYMNNYEKAEVSPDVLILMSFPDSVYYLVSTEDSYVGNLVKLAGGNNVYGAGYVSDGTGVTNISPEDIVKKDNEVGIEHVLVFGHYGGDEAFEFLKQEFLKEESYLYRFRDKVTYLPSDMGFGMSADFSWMTALDYLQPILYVGE